jgi:hypothetical protein
MLFLYNTLDFGARHASRQPTLDGGQSMTPLRRRLEDVSLEGRYSEYCDQQSSESDNDGSKDAHCRLP